jgi:lipid A 4'-phosphatase
MSLNLKKLSKELLFPLFVWLLVTPWSATLDLNITRYFYQKQAFSSAPLWGFIYHYGTWPAWLAVLLACGGIVCSFQGRWRQWRVSCLYFILTLALGSGLFIHAGLKEQWGRPRPRQVMEFGGKQPFRAYYQPQFKQQPEPSKSFACGHCTMGFCFFTFVFLGRFYHKRWLEKTGWILAWGLGLALSIARVAQGGHFFSDVLASLIIMWWMASLLSYLLLTRCATF